MSRSTKGLGRTQPAEWQDCGDALDHPELRGCHMPKGPSKDESDTKAYLHYNEVRGVTFGWFVGLIFLV